MGKTKIKITSLSLVSERTIFLGLVCLSFFIPFSLGHSQFLTGTLVNTFLFLAVLFLPKRLLWPLLFLPSLAVLSRGLIFGPLTVFLAYLLPFIWTGNFLLIFIFKKANNSFGFWPGVFLAALVKQIFLFTFAFAFFQIGLLPRLFLTTMGINQFLTASLGGFLAFLIFKKIKNE